MIQKEAQRKNYEFIKLCEDSGVYNMSLEMKVPWANVEFTAADGSWKPSRAHPWMLARPKGAEDFQARRTRGALRAMTWEDLEKEVMKLKAESRGFLRQPKE